MSKFKIGDKVKIIECLCESVRVRYINKIATITKTTENNEYEIDLDNGKYFWYPFEFELYIEQPKEYTIADLLNNFDEETEFIKVGGGIKPLKYKILDGNLYFYNYVEDIWKQTLYSLKVTLNMKFTKAEEPKLKPMTFEEAVKTGKNIRYEYTYDYLEQENKETVKVKIELKEFHIFSEIIEEMIMKHNSYTATQIILEGTWFAEGVYE